jgi:hypothetical protein
MTHDILEEYNQHKDDEMLHVCTAIKHHRLHVTLKHLMFRA